MNVLISTVFMYEASDLCMAAGMVQIPYVFSRLNGKIRKIKTIC